MRYKDFFIVIFCVLLTNCQGEKKSEPSSKKGAGEQNLPDNNNQRADEADLVNGGLFLPEGFEAVVVTDSIGPSRHLAVNTNGDIYVKLSVYNGDLGNMALRDTTQDGRADIIERFDSYQNDGGFGTEMRIHNGYLYFSSEQVVYRQKLSPTHLIPEDPLEIILVDQFPKRWHNAKSLAFDRKGGMYVTFSAPTNACEDSNSMGAVKGLYPCPGLNVLGSIWKFDENKLGQTQADGQMYATGIRSIVAISWNDQDNSLYAVQHGRDYLHNHAPQYYSQWQNAVLPAEEFMKIKQGDDFGWPYTYYDPFKKKRIIAPEYGGDGIKESAIYADPVMGLPAHWAPNDLLFYTGNQFPERYKNGAFIAFHGSTNRTPYPQAGYIVAFIPFKNGKALNTWEVFADGFTGVDTVATMPDAKYRPMGLAEGPDGSLYISDSKKGKIWRIKFTGDRSRFGEDQLSKMEKRKSRSYIRIPDEAKDNLSLK
ncbi:MAG: PQQ-dependent sugar dehydrogenase [Maribacter sp.]|nr:PQQ-dependent sugar dehydrogenase [Maribacter sp.]